MASERIFLPLIQKTHPEIVDMHFPAEGIFHNLVVISIDKRYPGHARKIMSAVWGLGQLMFSKTVVIVDKDVDVHNLREVAWIVGTHMDPSRDVQMTKGPLDDLDDACDLPAYGGKMGIDATRKWASKGIRARGPLAFGPRKPPAAAPPKSSTSFGVRLSVRRFGAELMFALHGGMWRAVSAAGRCDLDCRLPCRGPVARRDARPPETREPADAG